MTITMAEPDSKDIFVVDDQAEFLELVRRMLIEEGYDPKCFTCAEDFLSITSTETSGCLVTDLHLGGISGEQLLLHVQKNIPALSVVVISGSARISEAVTVLKLGAYTFLEKPFTSRELMEAIDAALKQSHHQRIDAAHKKSIRLKLQSLSADELQVMKHMMAGTSNKAAAYQVDLSERTLVRRRSAVLEKMQVGSIVQLIDLLKDYRDPDGLL
jgi:FixJ family two-component response regulator